jgi:hypothetical protein
MHNYTSPPHNKQSSGQTQQCSQPYSYQHTLTLPCPDARPYSYLHAGHVKRPPLALYCLSLHATHVCFLHRLHATNIFPCSSYLFSTWHITHGSSGATASEVAKQPRHTPSSRGAPEKRCRQIGHSVLRQPAINSAASAAELMGYTCKSTPMRFRASGCSGRLA